MLPAAETEQMSCTITPTSQHSRLACCGSALEWKATLLCFLTMKQPYPVNRTTPDTTSSFVVFLRWMSYSKMCASVGILLLKQQSSMSTADSTGLFSDGRTCSQGRNRQPRKQGQPGVARPASTVLASTHTCQSLSGFRLFHQACLLPSFLPINFCVFEGTQGAAISWCRFKKKKKMALCRPESQIPFRVL